MKPYSNFSNALKSEDAVLQEFYQERKKRSVNSTKRHSLLQKNTSYFSNSNYLNQSVGLCKTPEHNQKNSLFASKKTNTQLNTSMQGHDKKLNKEIFTSAKDQLKDRNRSSTQFEIMNKYRNIDKENAISTCRFGLEDTTLQKTKDFIPSTSKYRERRVSLAQLQSSFQTLTGAELTQHKQEPPKNIAQPDIDQFANFREKFKKYMPNAKFIEEKEEKKLDSSGLNEGFNMNEDIKIVNKVKSNPSKEKAKQDFIRIKQIIDKKNEEEEEEPLIVLAQNRQIKASRSSKNQNTESEARISQLDQSPQKQVNLSAEAIQNLKSSSYLQSPNFRFPENEIREQEKERNQPQQKFVHQKDLGGSKKQELNSFQIQNSRQIKDARLKRQYNTFAAAQKSDVVERTEKFPQKKEQRSARETELEARMNELQKKVEQLQKINKKQSKFIESVQTMRKVIDKTQTPCNLKQLWRWLKGIPNRM